VTGLPEKGIVPSHGFVPVDQLADATGVAVSVLCSLIEDGTLVGLVSADGAAVGVLDDALPTRHYLVALGLTVLGTYDPSDLQAVEAPEGADEPPDEDAAVGDSTWTIAW
jgi:hypothetical protein